MSGSHVRPWSSDPTFGSCDRCSAIMVKVATHECPEPWKVYDPECREEADATRVYATDAEAAVLRYVEHFDSEEHEMAILRHGVTLVAVQGDKRHRFEVTGESVPSYSAEELTDD